MSKRVRSYRIGEGQDMLLQAASKSTGVPLSVFVRRAAVGRALEVMSQSERQLAEVQRPKLAGDADNGR